MSDVVMNGVDGARLILVKRTTRLIVAAACVPAQAASTTQPGGSVHL